MGWPRGRPIFSSPRRHPIATPGKSACPIPPVTVALSCEERGAPEKKNNPFYSVKLSILPSKTVHFTFREHCYCRSETMRKKRLGNALP